MSVFSSIMSKIFGHGASTSSGSPDPASVAAPVGNSSEPASADAPTAQMADAQIPAAPSGSAAASQPVDVEAVLSDMAGKAGQPLNWRTSIVDLMKLLDLDSSLDNRKALASELHYGGDTNDSATMNIWLHKQVMTKLAENGGHVPADLKA